MRPGPRARIRSLRPIQISAPVRRARDFFLGRETTLLLPRWLVLRAVGAIFAIVFAGIVTDHAALIGPRGVMPLTGFFTELRGTHPNPFAAFLHAPSLFWLGTSPGFIATVAWAGLAAALALVLNLWPRAALLACWAGLLSFVTTWRGFTATQVDQLMLETALLCIPFAPSGRRPGLGATSPPAPAAVFLVRFLLFRVMFENGLVKLLVGDSHWLNFTALDVLYETTPFPTILGYLDHQLPHAWHVIEILLTFAAEIVAPLAMIFGGVRSRWFAFIAWTGFQLGIHLTNNFGWLNTASLGLGLLILDDTMIAAVAARRRVRIGAAVPQPPSPITPPVSGWLGCAALAHSIFALLAIAAACGLVSRVALADFRSANFYTLFGRMLPSRIAVEFEGSNDGGRTWRAYEFRHQPQREDAMPGFYAPRYARLEATLQVETNRAEPSPLFAHVAARLLARSPEVLAQFRADPFSDQPPTMIRLPIYQFKFTDLATWRATGRYWHKQFVGFHQPMLYLNDAGVIVAAASVLDEVRAFAAGGNPDAQYRLGVAYARGEGVPRDATEAAVWFRLAADRGVAAAQGRLGSLLLSGDGVTKNPAEAARRFRQAAEQGNAYAALNLALLHTRGEGVPLDESEALVWFHVAAALGDPDAAQNQPIAAQRLGPELTARADARARALLSEIESRKK